jgi:arylsulfatase A-like enzyme
MGTLIALVTFSPAHRPQNVIIFTLDTTRADRLPAYGFSSVDTPALDALAREGLVFESTISVAPLTRPAHASLFTGLFPLHNGVRDNAGSPLGTEQTTLAELLHSRGMRTGAFVGSIVLKNGGGLEQGFDVYRDVTDHGCTTRRRRRPANEVADDAIEWLTRNSDAPFLAWLHFYDAHRPYQLRAGSDRYGRDPYLSAIEFMDSQIERVLEFLDARGLRNSTVIAVTADHGESLGEHGEQEHGIFVYESVLHVPLIMKIPGVPGRRIVGVTRLVDVMPTLLDVFGVAVPPMDGVSLVPFALNGRPDLEAYSESRYAERLGWSGLRALRRDRYKVIAAPRAELYDLMTDPNETRNLIDERPGIANAMLYRLERLESGGQQDESQTLDEETARSLSALGYISPTRVSGSPSTDGSEDPKNWIAAYEAITAAARSSRREPDCTNISFR